MKRNLSPVKVSPVIKVARYVFLTCGIIHGVHRLNVLTPNEMKERVIRAKKLEEEKKVKKIESFKASREDVIILGKDIGMTDFPPGWDKEL